MIDQATIGLLMKGVNAVTWQSLVMIGVSFVLFYLAIAKDYEPLLLLPIGAGCLLVFIQSLEDFSNPATIGGDFTTLPDGVRPKPLLLFIDETNSLLGEDERPLPNPNDDPELENANIMLKWRNGLRHNIGLRLSHLLTQARSAGIAVLLEACAEMFEGTLVLAAQLADRLLGFFLETRLATVQVVETARQFA